MFTTLQESARHKLQSPVSLESAVESFKAEKMIGVVVSCPDGGSTDHCNHHLCSYKIKDSVADSSIDVRKFLTGKG